MVDIVCPNCDTEFEVEDWEEIKCPECNKRGYWDEYLYDDGDVEVFVTWG